MTNAVLSNVHSCVCLSLSLSFSALDLLGVLCGELYGPSPHRMMHLTLPHLLALTHRDDIGTAAAKYVCL